MDKIKSVEDLQKLREQAKTMLKTRQGEVKVKIYISMGTVGIAAGARDVLLAILDELQKGILQMYRLLNVVQWGLI